MRTVHDNVHSSTDSLELHCQLLTFEAETALLASRLSRIRVVETGRIARVILVESKELEARQFLKKFRLANLVGAPMQCECASKWMQTQYEATNLEIT